MIALYVNIIGQYHMLKQTNKQSKRTLSFYSSISRWPVWYI